MERTTILMGSVLLLVACGNGAAPIPAQIPFAETGVVLTVTQISTGCSADGKYRARVEWQVPETVSPRLEVRVDAKARTLFASSDRRRDSEETGDWVTAGLGFYLIQREDNKVIAATAAGPGNCRSEPAG